MKDPSTDQMKKSDRRQNKGQVKLGKKRISTSAVDPIGQVANHTHA